MADKKLQPVVEGHGHIVHIPFEVIPMMKGGMAGLMKQAQQMQEKMAKMQEELANAKSPARQVAIW